MVNMMSSDVKDKDDIGVGPFGRKAKLGRRSFSRYVKAVFFETSLVKKLKNKNLGQKLYRTYTKVKHSNPLSKSRNNHSASNDYKSSCEDDDNHSTRISTIFPRCSCTISTANSASSMSSSPTTTTTTMTTTTATTSRCSSSSLSRSSSKPESVENYVQGKVTGKDNEKGCSGTYSNICICLLLVSLLVLVIWGKVWAIFCTSTWLFFACRWSNTWHRCNPFYNTTVGHSPSEKTAADHHFPETDTDNAELYKKKIIMEGLLEKDRSRNPFPN